MCAIYVSAGLMEPEILNIVLEGVLFCRRCAKLSLYQLCYFVVDVATGTNIVSANMRLHIRQFGIKMQYFIGMCYRFILILGLK